MYFKGGLATDVVLVWQVDHRVVFLLLGRYALGFILLGCREFGSCGLSVVLLNLLTERVHDRVRVSIQISRHLSSQNEPKNPPHNQKDKTRKGVPSLRKNFHKSRKETFCHL